MSGKSSAFKDFPRQAGLDAQELPGEHRLHKNVKRLAYKIAMKELKKRRNAFYCVFRRFLVFLIFCGTIMGRLNE